MSDGLQNINEWLDVLFTYGSFWVYAVIFLACFIENLVPPFPGDSFILAGGGLVALGRLNLFVTFLLVVAGGMLSVMILYRLGYTHGRAYLMRKNFRYLSRNDVEGMERRLKRWGGLILVSSRFIVGMRAALALAAGIGRYPSMRMLVYSALSYLLFVGLIYLVAATLVENIEQIQYYLMKYSQVLWPIAAALVLGYMAHRFWTLKKRSRNEDSPAGRR